MHAKTILKKINVISKTRHVLSIIIYNEKKNSRFDVVTNYGKSLV